MNEDDSRWRLAGRVTFKDASRSQGAYDRDEVDAFVDRVEATLRDPTASDALTPADLRNVVFSEPPFGQFGYSEGEVDLFLDRVRIELTDRVPTQGLQTPVRRLLYPYGGWDPQTPVRAIDLDQHAIRVTDLKSNELLASVSLAEVTATPAQYGGGPVLILEGPGLEAMPIAPHPGPGVWRRRPKSKKPAYIALEDDWLRLAEQFGLAAELADEATPHNIGEHIMRFFEEGGSHARQTWRTPLLFGLLVGVPSALYWGHSDWNPIGVAIGVICLIVAVLAWRFKWEF